MDILANLVTPQQLSNYSMQAFNTDRANQDQWCWMLSQITGAACPDYDIGNGPDVKTSAKTFLDGLRGYQLGVNATYQGPGGSGSPPAAALPPQPQETATGSTIMGAGLFGPTNCKLCIWLKQNPWALLVAAAAIYFGFFYKKG
jgi:hypothetical protein